MDMAIGWLPTAFLITWALVRAAIGYAHQRGMLDQPGQRRSHRLPTPRGGGIGIVIAMLVCVPATLPGPPGGWPTAVVVALMAALALVALAGWWDDHHALPVLPRLIAQLLGAGMFSVALVMANLSWWWLPLLLVGGAWSINLHNFMDGIDGLLAQQTVFVGSGLACLAWTAVQPGLALAAASMAMAALGFGYYNRPPARIFMGDVGSGSIGLLIFAFSAMLWRANNALLWPALILSSAFIVDASLTLLARMYNGRRWYTAHREHLYQWLVRLDATHAQVDVAYLSWNLLIAAPSAWLACAQTRWGLPVTTTVYLGAATIWLLLKRRCLRRHRPKASHVIA
jgi:UDP-N-acetylmuramyl pentapeptide phosphotransferase/UDP-N-acetylglucosamine-1-phosphate transferase